VRSAGRSSGYWYELEMEAASNEGDDNGRRVAGTTVDVAISSCCVAHRTFFLRPPPILGPRSAGASFDQNSPI
jgi:hypothetical protein